MRNLLPYLLVLWTFIAVSQNQQVLYGLQEVPQNLLLNPGSPIAQKSHYGIPLLSQLHINGGSSGVSAYDIFGNSNVDINTRIRNKIFEMSDKDFFTLNQQLKVLDFGWTGNNKLYYSGGVYQELDFIFYFPRDLAILGWEGNRNYLDYKFDFGELSTTGDLLTVYHFGINKKINTKLTAGIRAKIYSSMISYKSTKNKGSITTRLTDNNGPNIYEHVLEDVDITLNTSGYANLRDLEGNSSIQSELIGRAFFGGNLGIGIDLGATYQVSSRITASASALDVGAIFHTKDVESYKVNTNYTLDGIELLFPPLADGDETVPYYEDLIDEIEKETEPDTITSGYTQFRPLKINASVAYSFGRPLDGGSDCNCYDMSGGIMRNQAVGLQYYSIIRPKGPQIAGTLFYYRRLFSFLSTKATYTIDSYSASNIGFGLVADFGKVNFYIAADNLIHYSNLAKAKSVSLQLGFNIKFYNDE